MVSSVSLPQESTNHWPMKAVMESGEVQGGRVDQNLCLWTGEPEPTDPGRQTDRQAPPAARPGQTDGSPCHTAQISCVHNTWRQRWAPPLPYSLNRHMDTSATCPRYSHSPVTSHGRSECF